jgi:uncharacterized membrane protein (DUF441 family)
MNIKKAIISAIILYAVMFLVASALLSTIGQNDTIFGSILVVLSVTLTFLISREYYFKGVKVSSPIKEGFMFGIVLVIVAVLIDIPVMVYGFAAQSGWNYFMYWHLQLGYLLTLIVPILVAYRTK